MNLYEAKKILNGNGYLIKEYSAFDDTFSHDSKGWDEAEQKFKAAAELVKKKIHSLGLDITKERMREPTPMNDIWDYDVNAQSGDGLKYSFDFHEAKPNDYDEKKDGPVYGYAYFIEVTGPGLDKTFECKEARPDAMLVAKEMLNYIDKAMQLNTNQAKAILAAVTEAVDPWKAKGYNVNIKFEDGSYHYEACIDININKKFSDDTRKKTSYSDKNIDLHVFYSTDGDTVKWKICDADYRGDNFVKSESAGTIDDLADTIQTIVLDYYNKMIKGMAYSKNYIANRDNAAAEKKQSQEIKAASYKRAIAQINKLLETDIVNNFWKAVEINRDIVNDIIMKPLVDVIDEYVYDNYANENGYVYNWDDNSDAWDYFDNDFVGYIEKEWDGDFKTYCEEYNVETLDELMDDIRDNWDWNHPSDSRFERD